MLQLRMKGFAEQEYAEAAVEAVKISHQYGGKLIVNDSIRVAYVANADGVHLGQQDSSPQEARKLLGAKIIGGTANTATQCQKLLEQGVDYLGVGPFRFTTTKKNLSPILGLEGYERLLKELKKNKKIPIYAIGGIVEADISSLLHIGIDGVAASGFFTKMPVEELQLLIQKIRHI